MQTCTTTACLLLSLHYPQQARADATPRWHRIIFNSGNNNHSSSITNYSSSISSIRELLHGSYELISLYVGIYCARAYLNAFSFGC